MIKQFKFVPKNRIVEGVFKSTAKKVGFKLKEEYRAKTEVNRREGRKEFKTWTQVGLREEQAKNKLNEGDMQISGKEIIDSE